MQFQNRPSNVHQILHVLDNQPRTERAFNHPANLKMALEKQLLDIVNATDEFKTNKITLGKHTHF
jgi:glutamate 5-kinase